MSGGSHNYAYHHIEDLASSIAALPMTPARRAFVALLGRVSKAAYEIEWEDSGDTGRGDSEPHILAALGQDGKALILAEVIKEAKRIRDELDRTIDMALDVS